MILYIIIFLISFIFLSKSGTILVRSLIRLAQFLKISEFVIAFILMSFATSIPELFIGISSAIEKVPVFSFGDVLGANFINITLVIGLVAILNNGIKTESKISQKNLWFIFFIALLPILFALDGVVSRIDGLILIASFLFYLFRLLGEKEYFSKVLNGVKIDFEIFSKVFKEMFSFVLGILILIASSALLVFSGKNIASLIDMDVLTFSILFVALGTTLPELTFGIRASLLKHNEMTLGNSIGSVAFNSSFVIGIVSIIKPIEIHKASMFFLIISFLLASFLLFNLFIYTRSHISRREGFILVFIYLFFIVSQYFLQMI